jgi:sodium transport system permease protein
VTGRTVRVVWRKELLDTLRDRRTIMAMIVVPLLVYPLLIIVISQLGIRQVEKLRASTARVAVLPPEGAGPVIAALEADSTFAVLRPADPESALAARELDAVIVLPAGFAERLAAMEQPEVVVRVDLSRDRGEEMRARVRDFLVEWREDLVARDLEARALPGALVKPFSVTVENAAGARKMGGSLVGRILPFFLVVMMMTGAFYPAIDVTAGERERGTLETLLVAPASRFAIVMGKFLTVFVASVITTLANMLSIAFTVFFLLGSMNVNLPAGENLASLLDARALGLVFVVMLPMALLFSSLALLVATFARSFKEAQNYLSPLVIACMAPAYLSFLPGIELTHGLALVPVANVVLLSRELFLGNVPWPFFAITMATVTALALFFLARTVTLFGGEAMLGGGSTPMRWSWRRLFRAEGARPAMELTPGIVAQVFPLVLLGFFYLGTPLQLESLKLGLAVTQIAVIAGIPVLAMRLFHIPVRVSLGLAAAPSARALLWTLLAAPGATLVAIGAAQLQGLLVEVPESYRKLMETLFRTEAGGNLALSLLVFALLPAVCEEILFRGFVLRGLRSRLGWGSAIFWTGILFGAFHFDLYRLFPTTVLGWVLGGVAWATGSLWPCMLLHAVNNALAVLSTSEAARARFSWLGGEEALPAAVLLGAAALGLMGLGGLTHLARARRGGKDPATITVD